ncbi:MAG: hypothetical protein IPK78_04520 [Rhodospirillales bacterium]|nr:hypothetical protein [Rhodospirillales bacterium]
MRILRSLEDQAKVLAERKRLLGITAEELASCRNRGARRTPEKRALLERIEARAKARGSKPAFVAHY